jgi:hypothetical protein
MTSASRPLKAAQMFKTRIRLDPGAALVSEKRRGIDMEEAAPGR